MASVKQPVGIRTTLAVTGLSTLANAAFATSATKDNTANGPVDLLVELSITPGAVSGNKQALLYALSSLDNTNFQTGSNTNDAAVMTLIGVLPLPTNSAKQTKLFSVALQYGGALPPFNQFVVQNDSGASFSAGTIFVSEVLPTVV